MERIDRFLRLPILALLLLTTFGVSCATADVAVQTSHVGAINVLEYHEETNSIVSGGEDGRIKVWDVERERIIRSVQAGAAPIIELALHPEKPRLTTISTRQDSGYLLQAWDMENGEERFSHTIESRPLFLGYSPSGDFVFVSQSRSSGVRYFDEDTGEELDYPSVPQGIVTYATVGSSGNTVMTYLAGEGEILYWDLSENQVVGEAETLQGLRNMQVLPNKRYAAAMHDGDLVVVDIVEGDLMDRVRIDRAEYLTVADSSSEIVLLDSTTDGREIKIYEFDGEHLDQTQTHQNPTLEDMSVLTLAGANLYGGTSSGELFVFESTDDKERRLVENVVEPINDITLSGDTLYVNTDNRITAISSDFFASPEATFNEVETVQTTEVENPIDGPVSFRSLSDGTILTWGAERDRSSDVFRLQPTEPHTADEEGDDEAETDATHGELNDTDETSAADQLSGEVPEFEQVLAIDSRVRSITEFDDTLLVLTRGSRLLQLSRPDFEEMMQYSDIGIEAALGTDTFGIVLGKTSTSEFDASVLTINPETRETVPLDSEAFLVFDLVHDEESGNLFALGLTRDERVRTTITRYAGSADLSRPEVLLDVPGEYLDGNMAIAPGGEAVYTSVGNVGITRVTEDGSERFGSSTHAVEYLQNLGGRLWSINRDGSASVWDPETGELIGDLYFFEDGGWALLTGDGNFFSSSDQADEFIEAVSEDETTEAFKLELAE